MNRLSLKLLFFISTFICFLHGCYFPVVATGMVATAVAVTDRRTPGTLLEDETIELKSMKEMASVLKDKKKASVSATSYNRAVLLTGWVPNPQVSREVARVVANIDNVRDVINEIRIGPKSTARTFARDSLITAKIKASFIDERKLNSNAVKVKTETGAVFLMGIVTQREADLAADIASRVVGVKKVVKVFEVLSEEEIKQIDAILNSRKPQKNERLAQ
tara:strand:- start:101 stop:757 length:657 start_codon:yes stop_codon:yes gene_type:complete